MSDSWLATLPRRRGYDGWRQWFWLLVYRAFETPTVWLRRGSVWAIGKAGDATDWGEP